MKTFIEFLILEQFKKLILYHGSYDKISQFKIPEYTPRTDWGYYGLGVYLTPNPLLARNYGPNVHECEIDLSNPLLWSRPKEELYKKYPNEYEQGSREWAENLTKSIMEDGFDGVIKIQPGMGGKSMGINRISEVCVFNPNDIKVLDSSWNIESGAEEAINKLRKQEPFFSKDQYDSFNNN